MSPWPEFHTTRGFGADESAVTVFAAEAPHNVNDHDSKSAERFLGIVVDVARTIGHNSWYMWPDEGAEIAIVFCPEHVELLTREGWTPTKLQEFLFEKVRRPAAELQNG